MTWPGSRPVAAVLAFGLLALGCSGGGPSVESFCKQVYLLIEDDSFSLEASAVDDPAVRSGLERVANRLDEVVSASPDDIRPSVEVLAGLTRGFAEAIANTDQRDPFVRAEAIAAAQQQYEDDLDNAVDRFNAYVARNCVPQPGG